MHVFSYFLIVRLLTSAKGQSPDQLKQEFTDIRNNFNGRYVRLYGACDNPGF